MLQYAGIDLGGTKIQSTVFNEQWGPVDSKRSETPRSDYAQFLQALEMHIHWILETCDSQQLPIGIGLPGLIDVNTGVLRAANLCANGENIAADLFHKTRQQVSLLNDCKAFALSEACLGNGRNYRSVLGVSIGTGIAGGLIVDKKLLPDAHGMAGEFGHMCIAATTASRYDLPLVKCGCGKNGCYETFVSGPGFERLGALNHTDPTTAVVSVKQWIERYQQHDTRAIKITDTWFGILADMINDLTLCYDPGCIVFGGGMSNIPGFTERLQQALLKTDRLTSHLPSLQLAEASEHSGARGAALFAAESPQ